MKNSIFVFSIFSFFINVAFAEVRWAYEKPPKFFHTIFNDNKVQKALDSIEKNTFLNKDNHPQVVPLAYYEVIKWINKSLVNMQEEEFDLKKVKYFIHRNPQNDKEIQGRFIRQGNRLFCFPCLLKQNDQIAYGEFVRKDVFLVKDGERAIILDRKVKKRVVEERKQYKDKSRQFEIQIMKGEFPVKSVRYENGELYHSLNCFYQLRLHYKGKKLANVPQVSFMNEKVPMFVSLFYENQVLLYMDNRIQRFQFKNLLVTGKLTEYELVVPSDNFDKAQFWYSPGLTAAPTFSFLVKDNLRNLGEGTKVNEKNYYVLFDKALSELMDLYRNDARFNAPEEYCTYIRTCFNANNKSSMNLAEKAKSWHSEDCNGVMTVDELKEYNLKTEERNKEIRQERRRQRELERKKRREEAQRKKELEKQKSQ